MASLTRELVRTLAGTKGRNGPVVTLYLDVDGARMVRAKDYEAHLDRMIKAAEAKHPEAAGDLQQISDRVKDGIDRSNVKGLMLVSGSADDIFEMVGVPTNVRNQLVVNSSPHIRQLEAVIDNNERFAVLVADRQRCRLFVYEMGELIERAEEFDELPRHEDDKGDWDKDHVRDHTADAALHHLKRTANVAFEVFQGTGFEHLILAGHEDQIAEIERHLHSYLKERVVARLSLPTSASEAVVREAAMEIEREVEKATKAALVDKLRDAVGASNGGVADLDGVLAALSERRVDTLLVSNGFERPGWRCPGCDRLAATGPKCPSCGGTLDQVADIVEEAVEEALAQSSKVEVLIGNADLDVLGRIGALLRF